MIDVSPKFHSLRYARAQGRLRCNEETLRRVREGRVPKGDVLEIARAAGISAAKRCSELIVFCHPIPLDYVEVRLEPGPEAIVVTAEVRSVWKTGVEVEAVTAVTGALLNAYDMLKPLDQDIVFGEIEVVEKRGGKSDFNRETVIRSAAILVISDSTYAGEREDSAGAAVRDFLEQQPGLQVARFEILPDDEARIADRLRSLADDEGVDLILTAGGTGLGPKDRTPEATATVIDRQVPGIAETIRRHGRDRTPFAMMSRGLSGVRGHSLIINLPGSAKGALESVQALFPGLLHIFAMIEGGGHGGKS